MKKIFLFAVIAFILCGCFPPSVQPLRAYVREYNPKKAGAEIAARYEAVAADNITQCQDKLYLLSGKSNMCAVTVYDISHSEPTIIHDLTFDVSEVMPSYHYRSCKCLIPYNNKMLMLLSLDGTTDCNIFFSINDDGSNFGVLDVSNDIQSLNNVYSAHYSPAEHQLDLYYSYKIDSDTRYILYEYSFDMSDDRFPLRNFCPAKSIAEHNDGYRWNWSRESCGYTAEGAWLYCDYLTIKPTDDSLPSYKIGLGYLDFERHYDDILTVFSIENDIFLYIHQIKLKKYQFIKLRMI